MNSLAGRARSWLITRASIRWRTRLDVRARTGAQLKKLMHLIIRNELIGVYRTTGLDRIERFCKIGRGQAITNASCVPQRHDLLTCLETLGNVAIANYRVLLLNGNDIMWVIGFVAYGYFYWVGNWKKEIAINFTLIDVVILGCNCEFCGIAQVRYASGASDSWME